MTDKNLQTDSAKLKAALAQEMDPVAAGCAIIEAYWKDIRGARTLPARTSVDPTRIDASLPHSFILERVAPGVARFRVCGQAINALIGSEMRGMPLSVLFSPEGRAVLAQELDQVFTLPAILSLPVSATRGLVRPRLSGRMILLPLASADGTVNRALGAIFTEGLTGRTPRIFDIPDTGDWRREPVVMAPAPVRSEGNFAAALPLQTQRPAQKRPALRLVVDNG